MSNQEIYLKSQEITVDTSDSAKLLAAEIEAKDLIKAAETETAEAKERYNFAVSIDDETSRKAAWSDMEIARQKTLNAKQDLLSLQAFSQQSTPVDPIIIIEAAITAAEAGMKALDFDKTCRVKRIIGDLRLSLQQDANEECGVLFGNETRLHSFAELHQILATDVTFALFASASEIMAKKWLEDSSAIFKENIDILRKEKIKCSEGSERKAIDAELEQAVKEYDAKMQVETAAIMLTEVSVPEVAKLYLDDRAEYNLRKNAGFNALLKD